MSKNKTNPKKIPRSQKDVDDAYELGTYKGAELMLILATRCLGDMGYADAVEPLFNKIDYGLDSLILGYTKLNDERKAIEDEYGIKFDSLMKHFGVRSKF